MKQDTIAAVSNLNSYAKRLEGRIATLEMRVASLQGEEKVIPASPYEPPLFKSPHPFTMFDGSAAVGMQRDLTESGIREM